MIENQKPKQSEPPTEPKTSKRVDDDGVWLHIPSGIHYERPIIDSKPTYRTLGTKDLAQALKVLYGRQLLRTAAYQNTAATLGEVIRAYEKAGVS